jgi:hypothetical protein
MEVARMSRTGWLLKRRASDGGGIREMKGKVYI